MKGQLFIGEDITADVKATCDVCIVGSGAGGAVLAAGLVERSSNATELRQMKKMLAQGLEEGAFGYSTGLEYSPERDCSEDEIVELCGVAAQAGGMYATHTRNRSGEAQETIDEAIRTAAAAVPSAARAAAARSVGGGG